MKDRVVGGRTSKRVFALREILREVVAKRAAIAERVVELHAEDARLANLVAPRKPKAAGSAV